MSVESSSHVPLQLVLLHRCAHLAKIQIRDAAGHRRITGLCGVPDLGAIPALQDFTLLIECSNLAVPLHPPMPTEFCANIGHRYNAETDPPSIEKLTPAFTLKGGGSGAISLGSFRTGGISGSGSGGRFVNSASGATGSGI